MLRGWEKAGEAMDMRLIGFDSSSHSRTAGLGRAKAVRAEEELTLALYQTGWRKRVAGCQTHTHTHGHTLLTHNRTT